MFKFRFELQHRYVHALNYCYVIVPFTCDSFEWIFLKFIDFAPCYGMERSLYLFLTPSHHPRLNPGTAVGWTETLVEK